MLLNTETHITVAISNRLNFDDGSYMNKTMSMGDTINVKYLDSNRQIHTIEGKISDISFLSNKLFDKNISASDICIRIDASKEYSSRVESIKLSDIIWYFDEELINPNAPEKEPETPSDSEDIIIDTVPPDEVMDGNKDNESDNTEEVPPTGDGTEDGGDENDSNETPESSTETEVPEKEEDSNETENTESSEDSTTTDSSETPENSTEIGNGEENSNIPENDENQEEDTSTNSPETPEDSNTTGDAEKEEESNV